MHLSSAKLGAANESAKEIPTLRSSSCMRVDIDEGQSESMAWSNYVTYEACLKTLKHRCLFKIDGQTARHHHYFSKYITYLVSHFVRRDFIFDMFFLSRPYFPISYVNITNTLQFN